MLVASSLFEDCLCHDRTLVYWQIPNRVLDLSLLADRDGVVIDDGNYGLKEKTAVAEDTKNAENSISISNANDSLQNSQESQDYVLRNAVAEAEEQVRQERLQEEEVKKKAEVGVQQETAVVHTEQAIKVNQKTREDTKAVAQTKQDAEKVAAEKAAEQFNKEAEAQEAAAERVAQQLAAEKAKKDAEAAEKAKKEAEAAEKAKKDVEAAEKARKEAEAAEKAKKEAEAAEKAKKAAEAAEKARKEAEAAEKARQEAEAAEKARKAAEAAEKARKEVEAAEKARKEVEAAEKAQKQKEMDEQEGEKKAQRQSESSVAGKVRAEDRSRKDLDASVKFQTVAEPAHSRAGKGIEENNEAHGKVIPGDDQAARNKAGAAVKSQHTVHALENAHESVEKISAADGGLHSKIGHKHDHSDHSKSKSSKLQPSEVQAVTPMQNAEQVSGAGPEELVKKSREASLAAEMLRNKWTKDVADRLAREEAAKRAEWEKLERGAIATNQPQPASNPTGGKLSRESVESAASVRVPSNAAKSHPLPSTSLRETEAAAAVGQNVYKPKPSPSPPPPPPPPRQQPATSSAVPSLAGGGESVPTLRTYSPAPYSAGPRSPSSSHQKHPTGPASALRAAAASSAAAAPPPNPSSKSKVSEVSALPKSRSGAGSKSP